MAIGEISTPQSCKYLKQLLLQDECEKILSDLPTPDYKAAPAINRFQVQVPLSLPQKQLAGNRRQYVYTYRN